MTVSDILNSKRTGRKLTMLTAYDHPTAYWMDQSGIDVILVGDSLANVVLGLESTTQVGMSEMLHHCKAVTRAVKSALVVGDMPFEAYQVDPQKSVANAKLFVQEAGCKAVKLEWFGECLTVAASIVKSGIAVMGHIGLTPQTVASKDGMKVQGKDAASAKKIIAQAKGLQEAGCFAIVLECIPQELARIITDQLSIPTFGIGAGKYCDGQVLVSHDLLGLTTGRSPKFSKKFIDLAPLMQDAFKQYKQDVADGSFPDDAHSFHMPQDESNQLI